MKKRFTSVELVIYRGGKYAAYTKNRNKNGTEGVDKRFQYILSPSRKKIKHHPVN